MKDAPLRIGFGHTRGLMQKQMHKQMTVLMNFALIASALYAMCDEQQNRRNTVTAGCGTRDH